MDVTLPTVGTLLEADDAGGLADGVTAGGGWCFLGMILAVALGCSTGSFLAVSGEAAFTGGGAVVAADSLLLNSATCSRLLLIASVSPPARKSITSATAVPTTMT